MKLSQYSYQKEDVQLVFSFPVDEKEKDKKKIFLELLEQAIEELRYEINHGI